MDTFKLKVKYDGGFFVYPEHFLPPGRPRTKLALLEGCKPKARYRLFHESWLGHPFPTRIKQALGT
ncbi:hypothetical protein BOMU111920_15315 [Bordetella muralis]